MATMICPRCGREETDPTARFCDVDGAMLQPKGPGGPGPARRGPPWGLMMALGGLVLLGVAVWLMWRTSPEVDMGTLEVGGERGEGGQEAGGKSEGSGRRERRGREGGSVPDLLERCYGQVPDLPATRGGREAGMFEAAKRAARVGAEVATAGTEPLSEEEEREAADDLAGQMHREYRVSEDRALRARVEQAAKRLRGQASRFGGSGYTFEVLDSPDVNAFMGPGGRGYVFRGLLDAVRSDDALAFVLGHEVAHSELRHLEPTLRAAKAGRRVGEAVGGGAVGREVGGLAGSAVSRVMAVTYDQDLEYEADRLGLCLAVLAGYPAESGMLGMEGLGKSEEPPRSGALRIAYDLLTTHPPVAERRAYLERLARLMKGRRR